MNNELWFNKPPGGGLTLERSLRFNSADSASLTRTPASAGNRKTWTWAAWVKKSAANGSLLFTNGNDYDYFILHWHNGNNLAITSYNYYHFDSSAIGMFFRDPGAWMHLTVSVNTPAANAADRLKIYINGSYVSEPGAYPTALPQSQDLGINRASVEHKMGDNTNGYLANIHFIDGQALDPTSFGEFDSNGIWQPIDTSGLTYGTNGFHLDFADNSTAAALGTDTSGNGNTWTVNNISVTAGAGNDSLVDVPTNGTQTDTGVGGEVSGNYCTWNPLENYNTTYVTLSNGNLWVRSTQAYSSPGGTLSTATSGKWYWEVSIAAVTSGSQAVVGFKRPGSATIDYPGGNPGSYGYRSSAVKQENGNGGENYGASWNTSHVIGVAIDADAGTATFYKNGVSQGVAFTGLSGNFTPHVGGLTSADDLTFALNAGQRPFAYTAPSGFKALCTANLPAPTIEDGSTVMDVKLYTGNGSTQTISGLNFSPDLVWIKNRAQADNHKLLDTVRGATNELESNTTDAEVANADGLTAFNSDGFALGADVEYNTNSEAYVAWTWDAGSSTVTNNDGDITSSVRANASAGFSVVTFTPSGASSVGHGLGVAPALIIVKNRSISDSWYTYHAAVGTGKYMLLDSNAAAVTGSSGFISVSASTFTVGTDVISNYAHVAYCFAPVAGYSAFGSYTGNGSTDGPFVYTGFRPRWLLIKRTDSADNWFLQDTARDTFNPAPLALQPDTSNAEYDYKTTFPNDVLSNGFKIRTTNAAWNGSGATYIYAAFAESPFALNARAR